MTIACHRKKNWVEKLKTQKSLGVLRNIISKKLRTNEKTILMTDKFENPKCHSRIYLMMTTAYNRKKKLKTQKSLGVLRNIDSKK